MTGTDLIEIILLDVVGTDFTLGVDHRVGVLLTVFTDVLTTVSQVGVEHRLQFDTHHVAPAGFLGEVEQIALGHALHLGVSKPLAIMLIGGFLQGERAVDEEVVEIHVTGLAAHEVPVFHTIEPAVLHVDVVNVGVLIKTDNLHTVLRLLAGDVLHVDITHGRVVAATADLVVLVVEVDLQHTLLAHAHLDVTHVDVLDDTTATAVGLDAENTLEFR